MKNSSITLYLEINNLSYSFFVGKNDERDNFKILYELKLPLKGIDKNSITNLEEASDVIKKNIYIIEQKLSHTFKEVVLILENFNPTFISLSGYKKLNGSQILRENITYILNTLKYFINENEPKKKILHIFNSKFYLDDKKVDNLPIGLFGDFYSHELSFILINLNDYKNINSVFDKINLKIKKILIKSFIDGVNISNDHKKTDTFFHIKINENSSKIFYFENNSLKFEQNFKFGTDIIVNDISKITSLKIDTVKMILNKIKFSKNVSKDELIEESFFYDDSYRKIKKRLIYEIAVARFKEISEVIIFKNINLRYYSKISKNIFFEFNQKAHLKFLNLIFKEMGSFNDSFNIEFIETFSSESMLNTTNKLVYFGWKKEAIPISKVKKSLIARFFDAIFG